MPVSRQSVGPAGRSAAESFAPEASAAVAAAVELLSGSELSRVRYAFHSEADAAAQWLVSHLQVSEGLSTSYAADVHLVSLEGDDAEGLLGKSCTLTIEREDCRRQLHGIVVRLQSGAINKSGSTADLTIVPALRALGQRTDSRIFQDKSVPEVLDLVLAAGLLPYKRKHESRLRRTTYLKREYIVQYRETDLEFVERLMSEEGIWYFFEHADETGPDSAELLVLVDSNEDAQVAKLGDSGDELPLQLDHHAKAHWQAVTAFHSEKHMSPTSVSVREYNWTNPSVVEARSLPSDEPGERPLYEPYALGFAGYADKRFSKFDTDDQARLRWEYHQTRALRAVGRGNVVGLLPGQKVKVSGQSAELDGEWIIVSVEARGRDAKNLEQSVEELEDFSSNFVCARAELPYRSIRLGKPRVQGVQTATVVGPSGKSEAKPGEDDIHTDEHGRIQVKLSWDRTDAGEPDASVTCFLRVAQGWGGAGWGFMFIPRIGMEVIVSFIDGDSDRPLITGCVYNGLNRPQHELPAQKTKSYIRTQSTPSGKGFNELQFDDADGKEQIYVHAQRDLNELVEHDQNTHVKRNQTLDVDAQRNKTVGGDETGIIKKTRTHTVHGDETLKVVDGSSRLTEVSGNETKRISKKRELEVTLADKETFNDGREVNIKTADVLNVTGGANKTDHVTGQYNITADKHFKIKQGADELLMEDTFYVSSAGDVQLKNAGFHLFAKKDGKTTITVQKELTISVGMSSITMKADGTITVAGGSSSLKVDPKTAAVSSTMVKITGAVVKIN